MKSKSFIGKEVYEQIEAFADFTVGKTVEEVIASTVNPGHSTDGTPVAEGLEGQVTISVDDFENALKDAYETRVAAEKGTAKGAGVGIFVEMYNGNELTAYIAGATTTKKGVIEAALLDNVVFPLTVNEAGEADLAEGKYVKEGAIISKKKLGTAYGMAGKVDANNDGVKLEWFEQAAAIEKFVVGKDAAALSEITYEDGKNAELGALGASMKVESIMKAVHEAASYSTKEVITAKP